MPKHEHSTSELRELLRAELSRKRRGEPTVTRLSEKRLTEALISDACDNLHKFAQAGLQTLVKRRGAAK
jgi:hypothetical protein